MHFWVEKEAVKVETRFGAGLSMGTEFLKECVPDRSTGDMANTLEPFTHEPRRIIKRPVVVTWMNRDRDEPRLGMLLATTRQFLAESDIPVIAERLKAFLALAAWNEQAESSDIPRILSQVTHWQ